MPERPSYSPAVSIPTAGLSPVLVNINVRKNRKRKGLEYWTNWILFYVSDFMKAVIWREQLQKTGVSIFLLILEHLFHKVLFVCERWQPRAVCFAPSFLHYLCGVTSIYSPLHPTPSTPYRGSLLAYNMCVVATNMLILYKVISRWGWEGMVGIGRVGVIEKQSNYIENK